MTESQSEQIEDFAPFYVAKMSHSGSGRLSYRLGNLPICTYLGRSVALEFTGRIQCVNCGKSLKKTYSEGHCFPCSQKLASCDLCIVKPELCHFAKGTCREPEWAKSHCMIPHVVYLANTSGLKVGITREHKRFERWGDQGATSAIVVARVPDRLTAGLMEVCIKQNMSDRTDWRSLIKGASIEVDLLAEKRKIHSNIAEEFRQYLLADEESDTIYELSYPIIRYPEKAVTLDPTKEPKVTGTLEGIRGQYLFIAGRAINVRKYTGYEFKITALD